MIFQGYGRSAKPHHLLPMPELAVRRPERIDRVVLQGPTADAGARHTARVALADRVEDKLPGIAAPTLIVRGEGDPLGADALGAVPRGPYASRRVARDQGGGHVVHYAAPDAFVAVSTLSAAAVMSASPCCHIANFDSASSMPRATA